MDVASFTKLKRLQYNLALMSNKPTQAYLTPVAFRDMHIAGNSNTNQTGTTRMRIFPKFVCQDIVLGYANYYNGGTGTPTPNANTLIVKPALRVNGKTIPAYFNGSRSYTIPAGGVVYTDPIPCVVGPDDLVEVVTYFDAGTGGYIPINTRLCNFGGAKDGVVYGSDLSDGGTITDTSLADSYSASIVMGATKDKKRAFLLLGDSIISGTGDEIQAGLGVTGFVARSLTSAGIPWNKISMGGEKVADCLTSLYIRRTFFNDHTHVIVNYPTNDMSPTASLATIKSNMLKLWLYLNNLGLIVYQTTIVPKTTSTDMWQTLANQSLISGTETIRQGFNAWLRDTGPNGAIAQSGGALFKVLDSAATMEDAATGKWKVFTAPLYSGTVESATSGTLICSAMPFESRDLDYGCIIKITSGTGAGQVLQVDNNGTASQIAVKGSFTTTPDSTSKFEIYKVATYDGTHPSSLAHKDMAAAIVV